MATLTRDAILKAPLKTKSVNVPQWGGDVVICEMPVYRRNELLASMMDDSGNVRISPDVELQVFVAGCYDPQFAADDVVALRDVSGAAVSTVAVEIMRFNGMGSDSLDDARGES